ncbi:hypothetical protein [Mesorhizobium sp. INR15]|uniref:hypothetical protein n=1 Tax=Mesorhizobium sp. INR15 TaxID=2654248 RepID=UPI0018967BD4|nr:hypothetical protein [Mesorhizobium sp. INR15]QPC93544.1 hypothetical protein GA829_24850 [Mesorhizobium sp. INR15]
MRKKFTTICVNAAGLGERPTEPCTCRECGTQGRTAKRAVFDNEGRWLVHWLEKDGEEWVGTYRLIPC